MQPKRRTPPKDKSYKAERQAKHRRDERLRKHQNRETYTFPHM